MLILCKHTSETVTRSRDCVYLIHMYEQSGIRSCYEYWNIGYCVLTQIKLVNINSTDIVDGRPSIVLGLMWTIILYFQVTLPLVNLHKCQKCQISKCNVYNLEYWFLEIQKCCYLRHFRHVQISKNLITILQSLSNISTCRCLLFCRYLFTHWHIDVLHFRIMQSCLVMCNIMLTLYGLTFACTQKTKYNL